MLQVENLSVKVAGKEILHDVNLDIGEGETHALFGPNASGKTTLLMAIMGSPRYEVTKGRIIFKAQDITNLPMDERARLGIGLALQRPPVVRGVKTRDLLKACLGRQGDGQFIHQLAAKLDLENLLEREVNYGFSGGEIKRSELLQLLAQNPDLVLLDEPESGVDLVNISLVGAMINELLQEDHRAGLIITHTGHILDYVNANKGYVLADGTLRCEGDPKELLNCIRKVGYDGCIACWR